MFVLLELESHGESVGDDDLSKFTTGEGGVIGGHEFEDVALLGGRQWVHPRKKHFALAMDFLELRLGPFVIFAGADDAFHLVA